MRKIVALIFVLLVATAAAQESYSVQATSGQVIDLALIVSASNERTCERFALADTCTQAQACTAANAVGGSSCTAAQARAANARIFPATQAGREEFVLHVIVAPRFLDMKASAVVGRHREKLCSFWGTANRTQKDAVCTAAGQASGCELCQ